jgi:LuxR family transcriptional regulator, maltose regulon positive regulatory protein
LESARGRHVKAAAAYRDAEPIEGLLVVPHIFATREQALKLETLVHVGETERVVRALADMDEEARETIQMRVVLAGLRLAQDDPEAAADALAPILVDSTPVEWSVWDIKALLLEAIARDALRDPGASSRALEAALDLAESGGLLLPFLQHPAPALLERHSRFRSTHAALISEILNLLSGHRPSAAPLQEPLSESELRVLRYLPGNLSAPEIARELYLGVSTVKTHIHHVYAKLGVHRRAEAVERARALGLLAPSALRRR